VACFTGSALIHAIPKLISEKSLTEFIMMFGFFFTQGFCLVMEFIMQRFTYKLINAKKPNKSSSNEAEIVKSDGKVSVDSKSSPSKTEVISKLPVKNIRSTAKDNTLSEKEVNSHISEAFKSYDEQITQIRYNFFIELAIMVFFITAYYLIFENKFQSKLILALDVVLVFYIFHQIITIQVASFNKSNKANATVSLSRNVMILLVIMGWLWTVGCFITQLPLYMLPMLTVVSEFYSQSFAIGSFIRTCERFYFFFIK
jgi:hypothetical protein